MSGTPPLRGYPVDPGLRRAAAARRRRGALRRAIAALAARRAEPGAHAPVEAEAVCRV